MSEITNNKVNKGCIKMTNSDIDTEFEKKILDIVTAFNCKNITAEKIKDFLRKENVNSSEEESSEDEFTTDDSSVSEATSSGNETETDLRQGYQVVKRGKRKNASPGYENKRSKSIETNVENNNKFSTLAQFDAEIDMDTTTVSPLIVTPQLQKSKTDSTTTKNDKSKGPITGKIYSPPPIICYKLNVAHLHRHLQSLVSKVEYKIANVNKTKSVIRTGTRKDHEIISTYIKEQQINSFTYTFKEDKPQVVVLKGVHHSYNTGEIKSAIESVLPKMEIHSVSSLTSRTKPNSSHNNFIVKISSSSRLDDLITVKYLLHQKIYWEKLKTTDIIQCFRCQNFGHVSKNCMMKARCVKCKEDHAVGQCKRNSSADSNEKPSCVNCGQEGHPANYRGCSHHKGVMKQIRERKQSVRKEIATANLAINQVTDGKSFARVVTQHNNHIRPGVAIIPNPHLQSDNTQTNAEPKFSKTKNPNIPPVNKTNNINNFCTAEAKNLFGCDLFTLMSKINNFLPSYAKLATKAERQSSYLQFVFSLCAHNI